MASTFVCPFCKLPVVDDPGMDYCDKCGKDLPKPDLERIEMPRFDDAPSRTAPAPIRAPDLPLPEAPLLVTPHVCHACGGEISEAFGHRKLDIPHQGHVASIYALLFRAPCCGRLVELPLSRAGEEVPCPACSTRFHAPRDGILHERESDADPDYMRFVCPACKYPLQCSTRVNGAPAAGLRVACLTCRCVIEIPHAGHRV